MTGRHQELPCRNVEFQDMELAEGIVLIPNAIESCRLHEIADAYDEAASNAVDADISIGRTTTRVSDFVNRDPVFDDLYIYAPLLAICTRMLGARFRLSSFHARTVHPNVPAQQAHIDLGHDEHGPRLISFIYMIDAFTNDNGVTAFGDAALVKACGAAGSLLVFDGAIVHGHGANTTPFPRRSLQGAFVRQPHAPAMDFAVRMSAATLTRLSSTALKVLGLSEERIKGKFGDSGSARTADSRRETKPINGAAGPLPKRRTELAYDSLVFAPGFARG